MTPANAQTYLDEYFAPWVRALDLTFTDLGTGTATATMPITPDLTRMGDILSGQALAAMADTIMAFACFAHYGALKPVATTNLDTVFLRPGVGTHIRCEAEVVRAGKQLLFTKATMFAEPSGKPVATATATFYLA
ncbi:PaaI family thioesterase [Planktotalea arctica]|uniref:PaaI family thioesterase n=1 Tax=Planktotalea arctica TaxID=1481893 RepID=UPI00321A3BE7